MVSGALDGIERALAAQLRPGDVVAVEDPGFAGLFDLLRALGLALRPVAIDGKGMLPAALAEALDEGVDAVVLNPRGQNPTGASLDEERAAELRARARSPSRGDGPRGRPPRPDRRLPAPHPHRRPAPLGRSPLLAKSLGPDLRLAVLAGDPQTISRVRGRQAVGPGWVSHLLQRTAATLWSDPKDRPRPGKGHRDLQQAPQSLHLSPLRARHRSQRPKRPKRLDPRPRRDQHRPGSARATAGQSAPGAPFRLRGEPAIRVTISSLKPDEAPALAAAIAKSLSPSPRTRPA